MEKSKDSPLGRNPFTAIFQEFDENAFFENLHHQVKNKRYFEKYRGFKNTLLALSYLFNTLSALTASYAIYWLTHWLTGIAWIGYLVAIVFLFFLEQLKRKSSGEFWQLYFFREKVDSGWLALSLFCIGLSLVSSGFGVHRGTQELSPAPALLAADSTLQAYRLEVDKLEAKSADLRGNKTKDGITFYKLSGAISDNEGILKGYREKVLQLEGQLEGKNELLSTAYLAEVDLTAWTLVWLTLLMELLFEACMAYVWFFNHRSYVERNFKPSEAQNGSQGYNVSFRGDSDALRAYIEQLEAENESLKTRKFSPPSVNGSEIQNRTPIGFALPVVEKVAQEVCADVRKDVSDKFTVPHTYLKGGEQVTVHYTMTNIKSRINQYTRDVDKAIQEGLSTEVINNRRQWLAYWESKKTELLQKSGSLIT